MGRPDFTSEGERLWYELRDWSLRRHKRTDVSWADASGRLDRFIMAVPVSSVCIRLIKEASRLLEKPTSNFLYKSDLRDEIIVGRLWQYCIDQFGMSYADRKVGEFSVRALASAKLRNKKIAPGARKQCYLASLRNGEVRCYSCGEVLAVGSRNVHDLPLDHLWPRSLGGTSDAENLMPICEACNNLKGDRITWDVFGVVQDYHLINNTRDGVKLTRMALHRVAAFRLAEDEALTLKEAYGRLGPFVSLQTILPEDPDWFFNKQAHNSNALAELWSQ